MSKSQKASKTPRKTGLLKIADLGEFKRFCQSQGWDLKEPKGAYEVLRMTHQDYRDPLLVYVNGAGKTTVYAASADLAAQFLNQDKVPQQPTKEPAKKLAALLTPKQGADAPWN